MKKTLIMLVLLCSSMASAQSISVLVGEDFAGVDLSLPRVGAFELGVVGAVNYFTPSVGPDLDVIAVTDYLVGPIVKLHVTPKDSFIDIFGSYTCLAIDAEPDDLCHVLEAGAIANITNNIGVGISYIHCDEFQIDDRWMVRVPIQFN